MKLRLENNRPKTKTKLWQRIFAWVSNIVAVPLTCTKSVITPNPQPISLTSSTAGVCEKTGHFRYVIKGRRAYLTLRLENGSYHRIVIGLGQGQDEVWVRKVSSEKIEHAEPIRKVGS
jgi:hypothetical protein